MNSFHYDNYSQIGLFTFYRQQAEEEEKLQAELQAELQTKVQIAKQSREEAVRKKNKTGCVKQMNPKQQKRKKQQQSKTLKSINSIPSIRFIKKVKLNPNKKCSEDSTFNTNIKPSQKIKCIQQKEPNDRQYQSCNKIQGTSVPIKIAAKDPLLCKKQFFSKLNSFQNSQKQILTPKQFNCFDVLELKEMNNGMLSLRKRQHEALLFGKIEKDRQQRTYGNNRLPRLTHEQIGTKHDLSIKRRQRIPNQYDPKDILKNNKKYQINLPGTLHTSQTSNSQSCIMPQITQKQNIDPHIQHYQTIGNSFNC